MEFAGEGRHRRLDASDSDSDSDATGLPRNALTAARASEKCPVPHRLLARGSSFTHLDDLSAFSSLDYVDLNNNALTSLAGLSSLRRLKTLLARGNRLTSAAAAAALSALPQLRVLNLADNALADVDWLARAAFAREVTALVVNDNRIGAVDGVASLTALETLVVSGNEVEDLSVVRYLPRLRKLSAARNRLRAVPEELCCCRALVEIRVAHNRIAVVPGEKVLGALPALGLLDLGHNRLTEVGALKYVAESLRNLNLAGNPVAKEAGGYREMVLGVVPELEVLDGARFKGGRRKLRLKRARMEDAVRGGRPLPAERGGEREPWKRQRTAAETGETGEERGDVGGKEAPRETSGEETAPGEGALRGEGGDDGDDGDDDAVDADEFVARAKMTKRGKEEKERKRRTHGKKTKGTVACRGDEMLGTGGDSAWG